MKSAEEIADELFTNGAHEVAARLVLTRADGRDLGGWCKDSVIRIIRQAREEVREECAKIALQGSAMLPGDSDMTRGYACGRSDCYHAIKKLDLK